MFRLTCCVGILIAIVASGSASAEMRDITTTDKFCFVGGPEICERDLRHVEFRIDWPGKVVEFRGTRVGFGSTVYINEPPLDSTTHYTEPTRLRASVDGLRLTFERTAATQGATLFIKDTVSYVLQFGQDGKCSSYNIVTTLLQPTSSDYRLVGVSCDGRIDVSQAVPPAANQTALDAATAKEACGMVAYFAVDARGDINKLPPSVDANKLPLWIAQCNANPDVEDCITTAVFIIQKLHKLPPGLLTCNCPRGQAPTGGGECELADLGAGTGGAQVHSGQQTAPDARVAAAAAPACSGTSANAATRDLTLIGACTAAYCSPGTDANARANLRTIDNKLVELQVTTAQTRAAFEHFKRACRAVGGDMTKTGPAMDDFRQATFQLGLDRGKLKDEYDAIQNPPLEDVFANTSSAMARPPYQQPECMNNINRLTIDALNAAQDLLQQAAIDCRPGGRTGPPRDIR